MDAKKFNPQTFLKLLKRLSESAFKVTTEILPTGNSEGRDYQVTMTFAEFVPSNSKEKGPLLLTTWICRGCKNGDDAIKKSFENGPFWGLYLLLYLKP